jgi:hypothetical protein
MPKRSKKSKAVRTNQRPSARAQSPAASSRTAKRLHAHAAQLEAQGLSLIASAAKLREQASLLALDQPMTSTLAKDITLHAAASLPGGRPYDPHTPDSTKIDGGLLTTPNGDPIWYFAQVCMTYGRFDSDGLELWPEDVRANGKQLGGFVKCIMRWYRARH